MAILSLKPCPGSSGVEQWTENPRVGGSNPPPGTIQIKQVFDIAFKSIISIINIHLNIHLLPLVPPHHLRLFKGRPIYNVRSIHGLCI